MGKLFISHRRDDTADSWAAWTTSSPPALAVPTSSKMSTRSRSALTSGRSCAPRWASAPPCWSSSGAAGSTSPSRTGAAGWTIPTTSCASRSRMPSPAASPSFPCWCRARQCRGRTSWGPSLAPLAYRHGIEVRGDPHFHRDADQLLDHLGPLLLQQHVPVPPPSAPAAPAALPVLDAPAARQPAWSPVGRVQRDTPAFPGAPADLADLADLDSEGAAASRRPPPRRAARRERRRTLQRVELLIGGVSALTLFLGQIGVALAVVWGIVATGLARTESYATGSRQSAGHVVDAARAARAQASAPARRGQGNGRMVTLYSVAAGSRDSVEHAQV